jgi:hypothetical protein
VEELVLLEGNKQNVLLLSSLLTQYRAITFALLGMFIFAAVVDNDPQEVLFVS